MKIKLLLPLLIVATAIGCTQNRRARVFGGTTTETLPPNSKLITATWKQDDLWLLVRPMHSNEVAEVYEFKESSSYGILEGKVVIIEKKN